MISVIIPVYNAEKYLKRCVESVVAQGDSVGEIILVDDGSLERSGRCCDLLKNEYPITLGSGGGYLRVPLLHWMRGHGCAIIFGTNFNYSSGISLPVLEICFRDSNIKFYRRYWHGREKAAIL